MTIPQSMYGVSCIVFEATFSVIRFDVSLWSSLWTIIFRHSREDGSRAVHWGGGLKTRVLWRVTRCAVLQKWPGLHQYELPSTNGLPGPNGSEKSACFLPKADWAPDGSQ